MTPDWERRLYRLTDGAPKDWILPGPDVMNRIRARAAHKGASHSIAWAVSLIGALALSALAVALPRPMTSTPPAHASGGTIAWTPPRDSVPQTMAMTPLGPMAIRGTHLYTFNRQGQPRAILSVPQGIQIAATEQNGLILVRSIVSPDQQGVDHIYQYLWGRDKIQTIATLPNFGWQSEHPLVAGGPWLSVFQEDALGRPYAMVINLNTHRTYRISLLKPHEGYLPIDPVKINVKTLGPGMYPPQPVAVGSYGLIIENQAQWYRIPITHPSWTRLPIPATVSPTAPWGHCGPTVSFIVQGSGFHPLSWWTLNPLTRTIIKRPIPNSLNHSIVLYNIPNGPGAPDLLADTLMESITPLPYGLWIRISQGATHRTTLLSSSGTIVSLPSVSGFWSTSVDQWGALWTTGAHTVYWRRF